MRVLLTGASGFLGANYLQHLLGKESGDQSQLEVICPVSFRHRGVPERLVTIGAVTDPRVTIVHCDLACPITDTTARLFGPVDRIVNFASESHIPRSIADPVPFVTNNINLMLNMLQYALMLGGQLKSFVQISTDEVYGPVTKEPHREWDSIIPSTPYSASKAAQEALAIAYWRTWRVPIVLVNTMNPMGPMQDPEKFVPTVMRKLQRGEVIDIHADPGGTVGARTYVHTDELSEAIQIFMEVPPKLHSFANNILRPDRWNVVGAEAVDNQWLARLIALEMDLPLKSRVVESTTPGHGQTYDLHPVRTRNHVGWRARLAIVDVVERTVQWALAHPEWLDREARP